MSHSPAFDSAKHERIHDLAQEWTVPYEGHVESPWGAFARLSLTADDLDDEVRANMLGHYILLEDSIGFKWLSTFDTAEAADEAFADRVASFDAWHSADDEEEVMAFA